MIKYALMLVLLGCFGYVGIEISKTYIKKQEFYENLLNFCNLLLAEIGFLKNDLISICKRQETSVGTEFNKVLVSFSNKLISNNETSEKDFNNLITHLFLTKNEIYYLKEFFNSLGKTGVDAQINLINYYISIFNQNLISAKENNQKFNPLFKKMGWIVGLLVCIVLI